MKSHDNKFVEKHEIHPFAFPSNSEFKTILKSAKPHFFECKNLNH